jgi:2'-5' RNA ligase
MNGDAPHVRLFVAIPVPENIRAGMAAVQAGLRQAMRGAQVRWTPPAQFHLTLSFLGNVAAARIPDLTAAISAACAGHSPLLLRAGGIGFFPQAREPRVVWLGVTDDTPALEALWGDLLKATRPFAEKTEEDKNFQAHITLGRIKFIGPAARLALAAAAEQANRTSAGEWLATAAHLMRSELGESGVRHSGLAEFSFASGRLVR